MPYWTRVCPLPLKLAPDHRNSKPPPHVKRVVTEGSVLTPHIFIVGALAIADSAAYLCVQAALKETNARWRAARDRIYAQLHHGRHALFMLAYCNTLHSNRVHIHMPILLRSKRLRL